MGLEGLEYVSIFFSAYEVLKQQISFILKNEAFTEKSSETSTLLIEKEAI